jgi:hypothetical protein
MIPLFAADGPSPSINKSPLEGEHAAFPMRPREIVIFVETKYSRDDAVDQALPQQRPVRRTALAAAFFRFTGR